MSRNFLKQPTIALAITASLVAGCLKSGGGSGSDSSVTPTPAPTEHKLLYFTSARSGPTYRACGYIDLSTDTVYEMTAASLNNTYNSACAYYTYANGVVVFKGPATGNEDQVFYHDIESDTVAQATVNTSGSSSPYDFHALGDKIYFNATTAANGSELWAFNTSTKTASLVSDIRPGAPSASPNSMAVHQGKLYFAANNGTQGAEPYVYDPDLNSSTILGDIYTGATGSDPSDFVSVGGKLYFFAVSATHGRELYSYDPAGPTLTRLTDINTTGNGVSSYTMVAIGSSLYFSGTDGTDGMEPYRYDTLGSSVARLADVWSGAGDSLPSGFTEFNSKVYFFADDGVVGAELFVYDPAGPSVSLVIDFDGTPADSGGGIIGVVGSNLIVVGDSVAFGNEYYKVSTTGVASRITDLYVNGGDSAYGNPSCHATYNNVMYHAGTSNFNASSLYKTDPAATTTNIYQEFVDANLGGDLCALKLVEHTEN